MMAEIRRVAVAVNVVDPHPNHQDVFAGVLQYAHERGDWQCFIDEHPMYRAGQRVKARGEYDGVIARADADLQKRAKAKGVALVNTTYAYHQPGLAGVYLDPVSSAEAAAEHLIGRGYQRFAVYMNASVPYNRRVAETFVQRIESANLSYTRQETPFGDTEDPSFWFHLEKHAIQILNAIQPPVAVFTDSAVTARMLVELCQHRGLHVPLDVAVLAIRNPVRLLEIPTSISAIEGNYVKIGYEAAALLDRLMDGEPVPDEPTLLPTPGIVARASTDHFAVSDEVVAEALRYISKHLHEKFHVEDIAEALNVSTRMLYTRFETALGRSIGSEIRRLRINSVRIMLSDVNLTVQQIADRAGFGSADVLTRTFKKQFGLTPAAFRKQLKKKG